MNVQQPYSQRGKGKKEGQRDGPEAVSGRGVKKGDLGGEDAAKSCHVNTIAWIGS